MRDSAEPERVLATVMFVDIVDSTKRAAEIGDRRWADLLESFYAVVRSELARYRGREIDTAGDGFLVTFDGPARAIRCAMGLIEVVERLGLRVRVGIHTGEVERIADKVGGLAVVIGARVGALAGPGEILVSRTVTDLVVGSDMVFRQRGNGGQEGQILAQGLGQAGSRSNRVPGGELNSAVDGAQRRGNACRRVGKARMPPFHAHDSPPRQPGSTRQLGLTPTLTPSEPGELADVDFDRVRCHGTISSPSVELRPALVSRPAPSPAKETRFPLLLESLTRMAKLIILLRKYSTNR